MNIGENIRKIRKDKKLTLKELGLKVDLSEQAIGQYERGDRNPNIEILNKIAAALEVSVTDLIGDNDRLRIKDDNISIVDVKQRAYDSIGYILSYATCENKIDKFSLLEEETKLILNATIDNIVAMTNIMNNIPFNERVKAYVPSED